MDSYIFTSSRLGFRNWDDRDKSPFYRFINNDREVMKYFPSLLTRSESDLLLERLKKHYDEHSYTFFAVDEISTCEFIGFIGAKFSDFEASFTPGIEIGWRIKRSSWGKGFATEGSLACISYVFDNFKPEKIFSITAIANKKSEKVMIKSGLTRKGVFDHPLLDDHYPLKRHVHYEINRNEYLAK